MTDSAKNSATAAIETLQCMLLAGMSAKLDGAQTMPDMTEMIRLLTAGMASDSKRWLELNNRYYREHLELWNIFANPPATAESATPLTDRRFRAPEWREPYFSYL